MVKEAFLSVQFSSCSVFVSLSVISKITSSLWHSLPFGSGSRPVCDYEPIRDGEASGTADVYEWIVLE